MDGHLASTPGHISSLGAPGFVDSAWLEFPGTPP